jgi:site-specific recombinase XerD
MKIIDLFEGFISDCQYDGLAEKTISKHKLMFEKILKPAIGNMEIENLMPIDRNLILQQARQYSPSTPRLAVLTFRRILKYARKCRIPIGVHADEIEIPTYHSSKEIRAWSRKEIADIRRVLNTDFTKEFGKHTPKSQIKAHRFVIERTKCLFEVMIHSGLRLSEALSIDKNDINWELSELVVQDCKEKGKWKKVYLHGAIDSIQHYLNCRRDNAPALFVTEEGKRLCYGTAQSTLRRLKIRAKDNSQLIDTLNHRICRKTFISIPLQEGIDPKIVQNMAHHSSLYTTLKYYYAIEKEKVKPFHHQIFSTV